MSFRSELKSVKSKLASGGFKQAADNPLIGFADQIAYGITKRDEEKRKEERIKRQEARVEARRVRAAQVAEEKKAREREKLANLYLTANAQSKTPENKAAVMSLITDGGITNLSDLETMMSSYTTYTEGTPKADIDTQMSQAMEGVSTFQTGNAIDDSQLNSMEKDASNLSSDGTISFTGKKEQDVLSMPLDQVRFELSDNSISTERRELLERRLKSLIDPATYEPTELYHPDGRKVTARTADEEATYLSQGFSQVEGPEATDYEARVLYKDGGEVKVYSKAMQNEYEALGYSAEKPAAATPFQKRTLYKDGAERVVNTQDEMDAALSDGFIATKPAAATPFQKRTLYKDGAERVVNTQDEMDAAIEDGFIATKAAPEAEYETKIYYRDGDEIKVNSLEEQQSAVEKGFGPIKFGDVSQIMKDLGVDRKTAAQIDNGTLKLTTDGFGNAMLVNITTGVGSQINGAPQNTGEADADLESQASISDTGALVFTNEDGSTEELLSAEDLKLAQAELGIQGRIDSLDDVTAAFGPSGFFGKITNTALGPVTSENPAKEAGAAMSAIKSLNVITTLQMVTMFPNIRDSVALKAQLNELLPKVGKFWYSDAKALEDFANAQGVLQTAIKTNDDIVNDRVGITNVSKSKAQAALLALRPLEKVYATIVDQMKKQGIGGGTSTSEESLNQSIFVQPDKSQSKNQEASNLEPEIGIVGALPNLTPELATGVLSGIKNGEYSAQAARNSFYKKFSKDSVDRIIPLN